MRYNQAVSRWLLGVAALAVAVAAAGLLWQLRGGGGEPDRSSPSTAAGPAPAAGKRTRGPLQPVPDLQPEAPLPEMPAAARPRERQGDPDEGEGFEKAMAAAESAFQTGDHEAARVAAHLVLHDHPGEPRMLRVVVISACALTQEKEARQYYPQLPAGERSTVAARCRQHGIDLDR